MLASQSIRFLFLWEEINPPLTPTPNFAIWLFQLFPWQTIPMSMTDNSHACWLIVPVPFCYSANHFKFNNLLDTTILNLTTCCFYSFHCVFILWATDVFCSPDTKYGRTKSHCISCAGTFLLVDLFETWWN